MTIQIYLWCTISAMLGSLIQIAFKARSLKTKAKVSNIEFSFAQFIKDDWLSIVSNQIVIFVALVALDEIVGVDSKAMNYIKLIFCFIGYAGNDVALRLFSFADKRLNSAIDFKTNKADEADGTLGAPTPAVLPSDKKP